MSETVRAKANREMADEAMRRAVENVGNQRAGETLAMIAVAAAIREQTQVMREASGV